MKALNSGLNLDEFGAHQKILNWVNTGENILEVGCASGYISWELTKKGCVVTGVEIDAQRAKQAILFCRKIIIGDIEDTSTLKKITGKFDLIILTDILEHLKNPEQVLVNLTKLLDKAGGVIISVPNVGFLTQRLEHFFGRFNYTDWGIMDRTHLRFFTKGTILQMIKNTGLCVEKVDYVGNFTQLPLYMQTLYRIFDKKRWWREIERKITGFWPEGLAVQFLFRCRKK